MRAYFFGNMYLSSIQQGIQAQHCTAELFLKYLPHTDAAGPLYNWAKNHKTSILLNGGNCYELSEIFEMLDHSDNPYPWAMFQESTEALSRALTCVGIILPNEVYVGAEELRRAYKEQYFPAVGLGLSPFDISICAELNRCGLAR